MIIMNAIVHWARMIKIEHTIFSLPFVISSALLAMHYQSDYQWINLFWAAICLFTARCAGMTINRLIDHKIDALNSRTQNREIPKALVSKSQALWISVLSIILFIYASFQLPKLCQILLPIAIFWILIYSYLKRFTWLCHFVLGTTLGGATLGAWIAVTGTCDSMAPIYLALAVSFWVAGFDIIYSTQDYDFDKANNLHSIPVQFGVDNALMISRFLHFLTPVLLYMTGLELGLGLPYKLGILAVIIALFFEQKLVQKGKIEEAFFVINSWISIVIMIFVILELWWT
jgi:4-hydroxybenzoate polyprenyltransferase